MKTLATVLFFPLLLLPLVTADGTPGGFAELDPKTCTEDAWKSVAQINEGNEGDYYLVPIKVVAARLQIVAGTNTELEVLVAESTCSLLSMPAAQVNETNCGARRAAGADGDGVQQRALFKVSIWRQPWKHFERITAEKMRDVELEEHI